MKYRKKPVEIEAFKWTGDREQQEDPTWIVEAIKDGTVVIPNAMFAKKKYGATVMEINTLEGVMIANQGDYIIKGIKGEIYPCKPDIFALTYEPSETPLNTIKKAFDDMIDIPSIPKLAASKLGIVSGKIDASNIHFSDEEAIFVKKPISEEVKEAVREAVKEVMSYEKETVIKFSIYGKLC